MRYFVTKITLVCLFCLAGDYAWADEASAVLKRAIEAHGGAARLERTKCGRITAECKGQQQGIVLQWRREETFDLPNRYKWRITRTEGGVARDMEFGFDGRNGWGREGHSSPHMIPGAQPEPLEGHWHAILAQLLHMQSKDIELKFLGEETKDGRRLVGIRAVSPRAAVDRYFDKNTGLLARTQQPLQPMPGLQPGKNMIGEKIYSDYREIDGIQYPMYCKEIVQNVYTLDIRIISLEFLDEIDKSVFVNPASSPSSAPPEPSPPPEKQPEERPSAEPAARWDMRFLVAILAVGSVIAVVWLIVRGSKGRKQEASSR